MRRWRLNGPLLLGLLLASGLALFLSLPLLMDVADPDYIKPPEHIGGLTRPKPPGVEGFRWGADMAHRDVFARVIHGGRATLTVAVVTILLRAVVAVPLGLITGWVGGWVGRLAALLGAISGAIPSLLFVVFLLPTLRLVVGEGTHWMPTFIAVLALGGIPRMIEQIRRLTATAAERPYVEAAIAAGASHGRILWYHLLPVMRGDLIVTMASEMALVLMVMGQLAIFGVFVGGTVVITMDGTPPMTLERYAEWGQMLSAGRTFLRSAPWIAVPPAVALGLTAACFHLLAEGLRLRWLHRA